MSNTDLNKFRALYLEYAARLISFARKFVEPAIAEDIVQDIFVKIWNNKTELIETGAKAYLFRAVRNACLDHLKNAEIKSDYIDKAIIELKIQELNYYDSPINRLIDQEKLTQIYQAIEKLPQQCKNIFIKAYIEDQSHNDIATDFNISVRTVENQIYKALKSIRESILSQKV